MDSNISEKRYNELHDRLTIAKHVINKMTEYRASGLAGYALPEIHDTSDLSKFTGVNEETIEKALNYKKKKTFTDWQKFNKEVTNFNQDPASCFLRFEDIRQIIYDHYVNKLKVPTKKSIVEALSKMERYQYYDTSKLENDMYYIGFKWKRLPNSKKYIVAEKSEQFMRRMRYFQRMKEYRSNNRVIIHVERTSVACLEPKPVEIVLAACVQQGLINCKQTLKNQSTESWLQSFIHDVPPNCVFVLQPPMSHDEKRIAIPTVHSVKKELLRWLEAHDIPHDPHHHSAQLYSLVQKYKYLHPTPFNFVSFLEAAGHEVVIRPYELNERYFDWSTMEKLRNVSIVALNTFINKKLRNYTLEKWLHLDKAMMVREMKMYEEDQKLELVLDNLMDKVNDGCFTEADFEECDGNEYDFEIFENLCVMCD